MPTTRADESIDPFRRRRQKQVVGLIRTHSSSASKAPPRRSSLLRALLRKLLAFVTKTQRDDSREEPARALEAADTRADRLRPPAPSFELFGEDEEDEQDEDIVTEEMLDDVAELSRDEYDVDEILAETFLDLDQVAAS